MHDVDPLSFIINEICLSPFTFNPQHAFRKVFNQGTLVDEPYRKFLELSVKLEYTKNDFLITFNLFNTNTTYSIIFSCIEVRHLHP
jgi:hypothetical protein